MGLNKINTQRYLTDNTSGYMFLSMKTDNLADRLKIAMDRAGMNQAQLADASGVAQPSIFKVLSGKTKKSGYVVEMAVALGVRSEWLALNQGPMLSDGETEYDSPTPPSISDSAIFVNVWDGDRRLNDFVAAPISLKGRDCRAFNIKVDTGFPEAPKGAVVTVDINDSPEVNDYVYAIVHGNPSIYRFMPGSGEGFLCPPDPRAPLIEIGGDVVIVGVVVYISRYVKP
ncbi:Helix-turn-helix protein [Flyfo siphovirus Tbat2_3]|nr:Helix-turn-helix protein [Flyfo siphovirus Tbat2_3]